MTASVRSHRRILPLSIDPSDLAAVLLLAGLLALVLLTFKEYAVSNDEGVQHHYGELIIAYYKSGFTDRSVFDFQNLYLYGGLFDIIAVLLAHLLPFDLYDIRHVLSALAGIGGVAATCATARMIAGPRAGLLAALALTLCGVWYGGMFNHTKDVPFAAAMMGATYYLLRAARDLPRSAAPRHAPVRDPAGRGARVAGDRPPDGRISCDHDRPDGVDAGESRLERAGRAFASARCCGSLPRSPSATSS